MRDAGMKAHDAGEHAKSEELLNKALEMFKS
jgi:predicted transcriptional regulator